jgi:acyl dehydratase
VEQVRFDDIERLRALVSDEFGEWGPKLVVTQDLINEFADLTGDREWIHVDVDRARKGPFGGTIAHGLLTLALCPRVMSPNEFGVFGQGSTLNYGADGIRFLEPVFADSTIQARSRLVDVQQRARGTRLTTEIVIQVVGNSRPSMILKAVVLHTPPT